VTREAYAVRTLISPSAGTPPRPRVRYQATRYRARERADGVPVWQVVEGVGPLRDDPGAAWTDLQSEGLRGSTSREVHHGAIAISVADVLARALTPEEEAAWRLGGGLELMVFSCYTPRSTDRMRSVLGVKEKGARMWRCLADIGTMTVRQWRTWTAQIIAEGIPISVQDRENVPKAGGRIYVSKRRAK